jgi:hypothetical protein
MSRRDGFDRLALRMLAILEDAHDVDVLARGNIAQGECRADHAPAAGGQPVHILHEGVAQTPRHQLGGERRRADARQQRLVFV